MENYEKQAQDFLDKTESTFECMFLRNGKYFDDDKEPRDIYKITLRRGNRSFTFEFGQSIAKSFRIEYRHRGISIPINDEWRGLSKQKIIMRIKWTTKYDDFGSTKNDIISIGIEPTAYDVLSCLTKHDPGSFDDFCDEYGYDNDSRKAEKIYNAVVNEWNNVAMLWNEFELNELAEII